MLPKWLEWGQRLHAIAQNGLTYLLSEYDRERYTQVREIASEIIAQHSDADLPEVQGWAGADFGYATPKVDVRGAAFRDGKVLLVREREDGGWTLPGGWCDVGQSPAESVVREIREESGYEAKALRLIALLDRNKHPHPPIAVHAFKIFFLCELTGGAAASSNETSEVAFFGEDEMPPLSETRLLPQQFKLVFEFHRHPDRLPVFD